MLVRSEGSSRDGAGAALSVHTLGSEWAASRAARRRPAPTDALGAARAGAEAQMRCLAEARVPLIASVSCNPVTFARDTALLLSSGYRLDWVQVVDQFRWSSHVEVVARLSLA